MKQLQKNTTRIFGALLLVAAFLIAIPASAQDETDDELLNFLVEFNTALDNIVSDYPNNFKNVLGAEKPAEEGQSQQYESQIGLPDEESSYFTKTLSGGDKLTFVSVYGEYRTPPRLTNYTPACRSCCHCLRFNVVKWTW